jgi:leucyl aminopeptidase (aminopeptidase T)
MLSNVETNLNDRTAHGVENFLSAYAKIRPGDGVVVAFNKSVLDAAALILAGVQTKKLPARTYHYAHKDPERFDKELGVQIDLLRADARVERVVIILCELDTLSFSKILRRRMAENDATAVVRVTNALPELFEMAFKVTPEVQRQINAGALDALQTAKHLRVRTPSGTDLSITLDPSKFSWISSTGLAGPREICNLPAGEISTYPVSVDGVFVANGGLNSNMVLDFDVRLKDKPMTFEITGGEVQTFHSPDTNMMKFLTWNFDKPFARKVGELGIGTNIGINRFIPLSSHINERHQGMHLGFGEHNQPGLVHYKAEVHLDAIVADALIETDTGRIFDTRRMEPSAIAHPKNMRSEDAEALASLAIAAM